MWAADKGHTECLRSLIQRAADVFLHLVRRYFYGSQDRQEIAQREGALRPAFKPLEAFFRQPEDLAEDLAEKTSPLSISASCVLNVGSLRRVHYWNLHRPLFEDDYCSTLRYGACRECICVP